MKPLVPICLTGVAVALTACVPPNARHDGMKPVARLDCPPTQGPFHRTGAAPDGRTCDYVTADGASQVQLRLVSFAGPAETVLTPVETDLKTLLPEKPEVDDSATPDENADADDDGDKDADTDADSSDAEAAVTTAEAATDADAKVDRPNENVNIDLPGLKISTQGQNANIHVGGVNIQANDDNKGSVHVTHGTPAHGQFSVDADDQGAVIRAKGGGADIRSTLIMASDKAGPNGWRVVGYEARGPHAGPLVIAVVKSKSDDHDEVFGQTKRLVRRVSGD